ncbi:MAG TPA: recombinase RecT [Acidimicrobiales bacterium]|nr:recombinase RecT [Acidimicrobiales bacterium]
MSNVDVYQGGAPVLRDQMTQADMLARSNLVPKAFRGKPADVLVAMMLGQELGLGPMATMSMVDVIEGNATLNAEGKVSLVRKAGHSINGEALATKATARGKRRDTGDEMTVEWTIQMAQRAGLAGKAVWKQYPEAMLWSRAVSQLCRMLFPDVLAGLSYTPEEVEAFTGVDTATLERVPPNVDAETGEVRTIPATVRRAPPNIAPPTPAAIGSGGGSLSAEGPAPTTRTPAPPPELPGDEKEDLSRPFTDEELLANRPGKTNPYAKAIHIAATEAGIEATLLSSLIEEVTGDPSANSVTRANKQAVLDLIAEAKRAYEKAAS